MKTKSFFIFLFSLIISYSYGQPASSKLKVVSSPSGSLYTRINKKGKTVIPNGRFITPFGSSVEVAPASVRINTER